MTYYDLNKPFTPAEEAVAECLSRGLSEKEAADKLGKSAHTINNHLRHIKKKNHLNKNSEVILCYIAYVKNKPFDIRKIREYGVSVILIMINICTINSAGTL